METILIVEDDRVYARTTANWLVKNGINARYVLSVDAAKEEANLGMLSQMYEAAARRVSEIESSMEELRISAAQAEEKIRNGAKEAEEIRAKSAEVEERLRLCERKRCEL